MKNIRAYFRTEAVNSAKMLGLVFALAALAVLLSGLFAPNRLGTMDTGKFLPVMEAAGLTYTQEDQQEPATWTYDRVIETYSYKCFSYAKLFSPNGNSSILYPITLIRLFTQPFGLDFSTTYLYIIYSVLAAYGIYMVIRGCAYLAGKWAIIPGIALLILMGNRNLTAYFGSLYTVGTVVIGLLWFTGESLRMLAYGKNGGAMGLCRYLAAAIFFLNASDITCVFIPLVLGATILILLSQRKSGARGTSAAVAAMFVILVASSSSLAYHGSSLDVQSDASAYHAAFQGFLETSKEPQKVLEAFGLDESYAEDIGKSYYLDAGAYTHNPRDAQEAELLFHKLNHTSIAKWYLAHPFSLLRTVNVQSTGFQSFESQRALAVGMRNSEDGKISRSWSPADTLIQIILPENYEGLNLFLLIWTVMSAILGYFWFKGKSWKSLAYSAVLWLWGASVYSYVPMHFVSMGRDSLELARLCAVFALILGGSLALMAALKGAEVLSVWFQRTQNESSVPDSSQEWRLTEDRRLRTHLPIAGVRHGLANFCGWSVSSGRNAAFVVLCVALLMSAVIQFASPRAGCVNNGDFGRMMDQLDIIWEGDIFYNTQAQLGRRVIETYAYRDCFDWTTLTSINPKYSLVYPAAIIRGVCNLLNQPFNTWYLSILMNLVLVLCIVSITRDLYGVLGKSSLLLGLGLCVVFLCESYVVWFNSLFGESCIFLGLFLVVACCVHLSVLEAGKGWLCVFFLMFSGRFLVCAKAQMLVTLPFVLLLVIVFALYHRPLALKGLIPYILAVMLGCILLCHDAVQVYQDNSEISDRQTVWQSVFYGALMVSDDPQADMEDLEIDVRMMPDIGKDAYQPDEDYVISPNSQEADAALYDHVNTFTMVKYYLKRPGQFIKMLNHAAQESQGLYNGFRAYVGQDYTKEHDPVQRLGLWLYWRHVFTFGSFWAYVAVYGALLFGGIWVIIRNPQMEIRKKLLFMLYAAVMLIGSIQYPLSVVGNGFADNQKQMFGFTLCHDLLVVVTIIFAIAFLRENPKWFGRLNWNALRKRKTSA